MLQVFQYVISHALVTSPLPPDLLNRVVQHIEAAMRISGGWIVALYLFSSVVGNARTDCDTCQSCNSWCKRGARCTPCIQFDYRLQNCAGAGCSELPPRQRSYQVPLCLVLDTAYSPPFHEVWWPDATDSTMRRLVFSTDRVWEDLCCAQRAWSCICSLEQLPCRCTVRVRFERRRDVFREGDRTTAFALGYRWRQRGDSCIIVCDDSLPSISINATQWYVGTKRNWQYVGLDRLGMPYRFFFNRSLTENAMRTLFPSTGSDRWGNDLCTILTHELGHIYGFYHGCNNKRCDSLLSLEVEIHPNIRVSFCKRYPDSCRCCYAGVMNGKGLSKYDSPFTDDDRCMFAKLYCPELTGIEQEYQQPIAVYAGLRTLHLPIPPYGAFVSVQLYDLQGRQIFYQPPVWYYQGVEIELPDGFIVPGVYFCVVTIGDKRIRRLILLP